MSYTYKPDNSQIATQTRARQVFVAGATLNELINTQDWTITTGSGTPWTRTAVTLTADYVPGGTALACSGLAAAVDLGAQFMLGGILFEATAAAALSATSISVKQIATLSPNAGGVKSGTVGYVCKLVVTALAYRLYPGEKIKSANGNITVLKEAAPNATAVWGFDAGAILTVSASTPITHNSVKKMITVNEPAFPNRQFNFSDNTKSDGTVARVLGDASTSDFTFDSLAGDTDEGMAVLLLRDKNDSTARLVFVKGITGFGEEFAGFGYIGSVAMNGQNGAEGKSITIAMAAAPNYTPSYA